MEKDNNGKINDTYSSLFCEVRLPMGSIPTNPALCTIAIMAKLNPKSGQMVKFLDKLGVATHPTEAYCLALMPLTEICK